MAFDPRKQTRKKYKQLSSSINTPTNLQQNLGRIETNVGKYSKNIYDRYI